MALPPPGGFARMSVLSELREAISGRRAGARLSRAVVTAGRRPLGYGVRHGPYQLQWPLRLFGLSASRGCTAHV